MSRFLSKADALASHIKTLSALAAMDVTVNRQEDLLTQVNSSFEKAAGQGCVIVKWLGGKNPNPKSSTLRFTGGFSISLWTRQVLYDGETPADTLIEEIGEHIHGWRDPSAGASIARLEVSEVHLVPDAPGYLVYELMAAFAVV